MTRLAERIVAVAASLLALVWSLSVQAETATAWNEHPNARVRLIAGEGRTLGVELLLAPGWKTYWRMPGDAGVPPTFEWGGSENLTITDSLYPAPIAMSDQGGTAVGYKDKVIFPVRVALADEAKSATARLEFSFGVCKDICIPIETKLELSLPGAKPWPTMAVLKEAVAQVPRATSEAPKSGTALLRTSAVLTGDKPRLTFNTRGATDVFIEAPDSLFVPLARRVSATAAGETFEVDLTKSPDVKDLAGKTLRVTVTGTAGAIETAVGVKP